eukprot:14589226-Alexandrium_andersonii.AAC.1
MAIPDAAGNLRNFLSCLELPGLLHVVSLANNKEADATLQLFQHMWLSWAWPPRVLHHDNDGAFKGEFAREMNRLSVEQ